MEIKQSHLVIILVAVVGIVSLAMFVITDLQSQLESEQLSKEQKANELKQKQLSREQTQIELEKQKEIDITGAESYFPIVEDSGNHSLTASNILQECKRDPMCVASNLQNLSSTKSRESVMLILDEIISDWETQDFYCHPPAHHMGNFVYELFDRDMTTALFTVDNKCGNALYHGIIENSLTTLVQEENLDVDEIDVTLPCSNMGDSATSHRATECIHGLGHAIHNMYNDDFFEGMKRCDEFATVKDQLSCQDGFFMENHVENFQSGGGEFVDGDKQYPCNQLDAKYQDRCYTYQGYYILKQNNWDAASSFLDCEDAPTEALIKTCVGAVSNYKTSHTYFYDIDGVAKMCSSINPKYQDKCIYNAVFVYVRYIDVDLGDDLCNLLESDKIEWCLGVWKHHIEVYNR